MAKTQPQIKKLKKVGNWENYNWRGLRACSEHRPAAPWEGFSSFEPMGFIWQRLFSVTDNRWRCISYMLLLFYFSPKTCDLTKSHRNIFLIFEVNSLLQRSIFKKKCVWKYSLLLWVSASNNNNNRKTALGSAASVYTAQRCNKYVMWVMARHA